MAGGTGSRMGADIPKQFLVVAGLPIVMHTIKAFLAFDATLEVVLALPDSQFDAWTHLCETYSFHHNVTLVSGGATRFESVRNALKKVDDDRIVAIHDAVRPMVSQQLIEHAYRDALTFGNAIPAIPVAESVRWVEDRKNHPVDRTQLRLVQTPQVFDAGLIKRAFLRAGNTTFTDDAQVLEAMGETIHLIPGERMNIKITFPEDIYFAENILAGR